MNNIMRTIPGKIIIYTMTCVMMLMALLTAGVAVGNYAAGLYEKTPEEVINDEVDSISYNAAHMILGNELDSMKESGEFEEDYDGYDYEEYDWAMSVADNYLYSIVDEKGKTLRESVNFDGNKVKYTYYLKADEKGNTKWHIEQMSKTKDDSNGKYITVKSYFDGDDGMPDMRDVAIRKKTYELLYKYQSSTIPLCVSSVILSIVFFVMMLCVSARRPKTEELHPGYFNKVPFDVMFAAAFFVGCVMMFIAAEAMEEEITIFMIVISIIYAVFVFNALCMSAAARIKQGNLFTNTLTFMVCRWCFKLAKIIVVKYIFGVIKWFFSLVVGIFQSIKEIINRFPLIWKSVAVFCVLSFLELMVVGITDGEIDNYIICWFLSRIVFFVVMCRFVLGLRGLQAGGRALAAGDFEHKVDTSKLHMDFKEHGENLNRISDGMVIAVEEKMKSERMKTELITNVSHDIKTPLTSIINYTDLIGKEETDNKKIKEYTEVLLRQSERLKRLIEDLVEASKASTGNIEVELAPCEASMFITQIAGEYEEKLNAAGLTLVTKINSGSDGAKIMADGRRMLRVFDNLMNNICKYALENSRVYLSLDVDSNVVITFKNTSRTELDMSPDELMERFVRGDESRNTEGNGLGLSIARSLTELQGGTFDIMIDGDLFKVVLTFPIKQ
ncbi:MAG: sensor histidine kinase [Lachnospiraceae bacterium]|nr:sensor histidine kinase [Lachnospiraceae bacterium]